MLVSTPLFFEQSLAPHHAQQRLLLLTFGAATVVVGALMCYTEHHLKRLLAFSTISHAGLMLCAFALGGPLALQAMLLYLLGHAFVKSSLFFTSGLILRRLRSIGERALFGQGRGMVLMMVLWFLGGAGLASAPGFLTCTGELASGHAAQGAGFPEWGVTLLFWFSGTLTAAAVFRVGMHTFLGWGETPMTDEAAEIGELPEQPDAEKALRWYHVAPVVICLLLAVSLAPEAQWQRHMQQAAANMATQAAYFHTLYTAQPAGPGLPPAPEHNLATALGHGLLTLASALALAASSVFRKRLPAIGRIGTALESGAPFLRAWQSGHPGDYVFWLVSGVSLFGLLSLVMLR